MARKNMIGVFQAQYQVISQTVHCVFMRARAGNLVDLFLYETLAPSYGSLTSPFDVMTLTLS